MTSKHFYAPLTILSLLVPATPLNAWGPIGHHVIGEAAFGRLDERAAHEVMIILEAEDEAAAAQALDTACNWPDTVRTTPEWAWSAPLHYVNLPRHSRDYDRERDCPDGLCVTEGILRYAAVLDRPAAEPEARWQALAFLCHLVGDLHQPLHAGFRDDRGGNRVEVRYDDRSWNLHEWWDGVLVEEGLEDGHDPLVVRTDDTVPARGPWHPDDVRRWTEESHALALEAAYPPAPVIDDAFAGRSRDIIERQWGRAAARLARILNAVLGSGAVEVGEAEPAGSP
jgi:hypothetical protein